MPPLAHANQRTFRPEGFTIHHIASLSDQYLWFESDPERDKTNRKTMAVIDPPIEINIEVNSVRFSSRNERGQHYLQQISDELNVPVQGKHLCVKLENYRPESEESRFKNAPIRRLLQMCLDLFNDAPDSVHGLYGAFAYGFVSLIEDIEITSDGPLARLFFADTVMVYHYSVSELEVSVLRPTTSQAKADVERIRPIESFKSAKPFDARLTQIHPTDDEFMQNVSDSVEKCRRGDFFETVLSRQYQFSFEGDPLTLFETYKQLNSTDYMFFFDFGDEVLTGCSPEMMIQVHDRNVRIRPISGTVRRSNDPVEDHRLLMQLLNSEKENAELDMLIDLARNDLSRVCEPGVAVDRYRLIEQYRHLTHTAAEVHGRLSDDHTGLDVLFASLNAGTLTGAPKLAAMEWIEERESKPRGYYGGAVGYITTGGDVNTAITIRSAHIRNSKMTYRAGATLLALSDPISELRETQYKAASFLEAINVKENR